MDGYYRALEETAYLLRSPTNVRRLVESTEQDIVILQARYHYG